MVDLKITARYFKDLSPKEHVVWTSLIWYCRKDKTTVLRKSFLWPLWAPSV